MKLLNKDTLKKDLKENFCVDSYEYIESQLKGRVNACDKDGKFNIVTRFFAYLPEYQRPLVHLTFKIKDKHLNGEDIFPLQGDSIDVNFICSKRIMD